MLDPCPGLVSVVNLATPNGTLLKVSSQLFGVDIFLAKRNRRHTMVVVVDLYYTAAVYI